MAKRITIEVELADPIYADLSYLYADDGIADVLIDAAKEGARSEARDIRQKFPEETAKLRQELRALRIKERANES